MTGGLIRQLPSLAAVVALFAVAAFGSSPGEPGGEVGRETPRPPGDKEMVQAFGEWDRLMTLLIDRFNRLYDATNSRSDRRAAHAFEKLLRVQDRAVEVHLRTGQEIRRERPSDETVARAQRKLVAALRRVQRAEAGLLRYLEDCQCTGGRGEARLVRHVDAEYTKTQRAGRALRSVVR